MPTLDLTFLRKAYVFALCGEGHTRPNPPVGAVIAVGRKAVGFGYHRRAGEDHAEVAAIKDAVEKGATAATFAKATLYVTLEPCSRAGRVGACTDAIAAAGIRRVVYAMSDPNPANRGKAKRVLAKRGIDCAKFEFAEAKDERPFKLLIAPFAKHVTKGLPHVTVKLAMSLDGRICDDYGKARWVSSGKARQLTGGMRARVDAVMVGAETLRKDNPSLLSHGRANPDLLRVIVTRSGSLPPKARVFTDGQNETIVLKTDGTAGGLRKAMRQLARRGVMDVLCEGGLELARSLAAAGLVDRWLTVLSPCVIGHSPIARKKSLGFLGGKILPTDEHMLLYGVED